MIDYCALAVSGFLDLEMVMPGVCLKIIVGV